ncbi:MAG: trypsin-like peptidase domain-containing protein [Fibrobacteres bacterium]|nr:trypsin-like peptidase domain-containing protein [Fibrobacterota bacterium]
MVQGRAGDTTAGSWTGSLPGIGGLPTPVVAENPPYILMRRPLSKDPSPLSWPARTAVRLDLKIYTGAMYPRCSGILVGPKRVLTAAHCLVSPTSISSIHEQWVSDSFFVRPGFNLGRDYPGMEPVRVVKSTISKSVFPISGGYNGDNDWALLELESDLGTSMGWAQVAPMETSREDRMIHMMGYPVIPSTCRAGQVCDTVSRKDTLCHSWGPLGRNHFGPILDWVPLVPAWQGESGSGILDCPDDVCVRGSLRTRGTRWTLDAINAFDSTMSGVIASILSDVKIPESTLRSTKPSKPVLRMRWTSPGLEVETDRLARIEVLDARGRSLLRTGEATNWTLERLNRKGVLLVVARFATGLTKTATTVSNQ